MAHSILAGFERRHPDQNMYALLRGSSRDDDQEKAKMASLFQEFRLKDVVLRNRIAVSPMCQYSSDNGFPNDWHFVHLGSRAVGGAGLVMVEATAVTPEGRISPADSGIYLDEHVEPFARISRFLKQHGAVPGIQLAHAGRKASASKPGEGNKHIETDKGGWDIIAPSAVPFGGTLPKIPREMTVQDIASVQEAFVAAAKRALAAGFEWLELHYAHGYLAHEFYSPLANKRTDSYGGSFENRIRFLLETFAAVRKVWPERLPLTVRLSVTDWIEGGVTLDDSVELVRRLKSAGLDLLDVSYGSITPDISKVPWGPGFMIPAASRIRRESALPTAVGWQITEPQQAEDAIRDRHTDLVMLAREMLRDPYWPYHAALKLGDEKAATLLPIQYARAAKKR
jgi:2,4-dienoyl-CoA reductase-like NADH-dependent reductase (Old Yellow Enzyme family)